MRASSQFLDSFLGYGGFENWFFVGNSLHSNIPLKTDSQIPAETRPLLIGLRGARANLVPGLIIQAAMIMIVLAYYFYEPARAWMAQLARLKGEWGYGFSFVSGALAGGVLPELLTVVVFQRGRVRRENVGNLIFGILYWGVQGMIVDGLYRLQAVMFGAHVDFATVAKKVFVDQFIFNTLYAQPFGIAVYAWKNQGYRVAGLGRTLTWGFYKERTLPALMATWGVWIPLVSMIYSLPSLLQIPLFSLALTFWVILFTWINLQHKNAEPPG